MSAYRKWAAQARRKYYKQFKHEAQNAHECRLIPLDNLLSAPVTDFEMGPMCEAFMHWSAAVCRTKPGEGPHCFTCDAEFGPDRTVPAAFWFQFSFARQPTVMAITALCPDCFERKDCIDRIVTEVLKSNPNVQVVPMIKQ